MVLFAYIGWYKTHLEINYLHSPVLVWYPEIEPLSVASFMPINRVTCQCAQVLTHIEFPKEWCSCDRYSY